MLSGNVSFSQTHHWTVSWQTSYNFTQGTFADHVLRLDRDLHDWRATFTFVRSPNGNFLFNFFIALIDRNSGLFHDVRRRDAAGPGDGLHPLEIALCHWVLSERRSLRVGDLAAPDAAFGVRAKRGNSLASSVMAVPLVVEGRILGVVGIESESPEAHDAA